jgi:uncharacterized protein YegP (UPF0339 family)
MAGEYFHILKSDKNGQYWWQLRAANHQVIGTSAETYVNKQHAIDMAGVVRSLTSATPIYDIPTIASDRADRCPRQVVSRMLLELASN